MHRIYKIVFFFSVILTLVAVIAAVVFGLNFGVDFKGGSILELEFSKDRPAIIEVQKVLDNSFTDREISLSEVGDKGLMLRTGELSETEHQTIIGVINSEFSSSEMIEKRFDSVGPIVGKELEDKSITALVLTLLTIIVYIAFVFRKMSVVLSSWAMGVAAIAALFHDIVIPIGVFALLGHYLNVEVGAIFVAAVLTVLGYSVSDTVVIFDRVRENVIRNRLKESFANIVHKSVMQTLTRSLNTTFTTLLSLIAIFLFGGESLRYFALALIIGIFLGAYSSIFVASPLLVWWSEWTRGRRK
ncbi:MAG: protein-export membrane protein SecF [Candidatus Yanofskybacteria bacterium RIFCSPHIGHO2_02_FULL_39_10]|uniref:Protein-export membrane protein SecF n=1 Tax=Candidatus Yanofskybacteria bacterium RIFCSPHIGHO2_02_FULL_39_10 TaxID=1802674 RepID=A0A1F8F9B2_9BACT|nr:MAG: protein-export membrane protein SecF [Candidatus Yanofskybacteria bacterium RIFCSPHIGHO2_02_FULL_39_10]